QNHARELIALPAFKNALHRCLGYARVSYACSAILVHVAGLSADVGLICFANSAHLGNAPVLHREPNALQHEPRGFLSYAKCTVKLVRANAVLAVGSEPHCRKLLVQANRRIFKDRSNLGRKLLTRMSSLALPNFGVRQKRHALGTATRACDAIRPAHFR